MDIETSSSKRCGILAQRPGLKLVAAGFSLRSITQTKVCGYIFRCGGERAEDAASL